MKTITVNELKKVLKQTLAEEKAVEVLREEVTHNLGPSVVTDVKLERLAENVNDRIDVLERTGRGDNLNFRPSTVLRFAEHKNPEVRRLAARLSSGLGADFFMNATVSGSRQRLAILGSTGSVGANTLDVARRHPEAIEVVGLSAFRRMADLAAQCDRTLRLEGGRLISA